MIHRITTAWNSLLVVDVSGHTPGIGDRAAPLPRLVISPVAQRVQDGTPSCVQSIRHGFIAIIAQHRCARLTHIVAVVVFQVVNAPIGKGLRIDFLVTKTTRVACTCVLKSLRKAIRALKVDCLLTSPALEYMPYFKPMLCIESATAAIPFGNLVVLGIMLPFEPRAVAQQSSRMT